MQSLCTRILFLIIFDFIGYLLVREDFCNENWTIEILFFFIRNVNTVGFFDIFTTSLLDMLCEILVLFSDRKHFIFKVLSVMLPYCQML